MWREAGRMPVNREKAKKPIWRSFLHGYPCYMAGDRCKETAIVKIDTWALKDNIDLFNEEGRKIASGKRRLNFVVQRDPERLWWGIMSERIINRMLPYLQSGEFRELEFLFEWPNTNKMYLTGVARRQELLRCSY